MKGWVLLASAALHVMAVMALLPWAVESAGGPAEAPPIEVELMQQADAKKGADPAAADAAASTPILAEPPAPPDAEAAPRPAGSPAPTAPSRTAAAVNLGDAPETRDGIDVTGKGVVPPSPDSKFRNQPPAYPIEAARQHMEGTVSLVIRVSAQGLPQDVVVAGSSGAAALDRAARNAVRRWRFTPARIQGNAVPFDYSLDIRFVLGDKP